MAMPSTVLITLKSVVILLFAGWVCLWLLKPTDFWTKTWHKAEDRADNTIFGYQGLNFAVYSFPLIAVAIFGFIYLHFHAEEPKSSKRMSITSLTNPFIVRGPMGILSLCEILVAALFIIFLAWTVYARVSNDFKKMTPVKSLKLNEWQYKLMRFGTRFGLVAEACLALLLLPILRGMAVFRLIGLSFEASVRYHVWLGTAMIFFATLHGSITLFIWGIKHQIQDEMWKWQSTGRVYLAGEIALFTGLVIWITSLPWIRRKQFELFYYTHHLYALFLIAFLIHGGDRHFYMVFPGVFLFALDKVLRIIQSRVETCVVSARIFPCRAIELTLPKHPGLKYTPTSVIFLKVPSISRLQWHLFSITSSSTADDETLSVIVKGEGWWTNALYSRIVTAVDSKTHQVKYLPVSVEGPYGPTSMDFLRYDSLLLLAGGVGITPFLSILQEIASTQDRNKSGLPKKVQLIYAVKKSEDITLLRPILPLLANQIEDQLHLRIKIFVTQELKSATNLRELLNELTDQVQTVNFESVNCVARGIESFPWLAAIALLSSIKFMISLVCLDHAFLHSEKRASKKKSPSWFTDILLLCSFVIAIISGTFIVAITRWRKMRNDARPVYQKPIEGTDLGSIESSYELEEHEVHYGRRPDFGDIFSKIASQSGGSTVGVFVCGPESMKQSVAQLCKPNLQGLSAKRSTPSFCFHSLNFEL
ncbi:hypothetical protein Scep_017922 [Stephania cephalantha]|uniref:FAD-binding FR-type domain-containing protein n=1 Tax=Stephania cephalantha TaxID=152367 RepID=A0AAP0NVD2_9MAGN